MNKLIEENYSYLTKYEENEGLRKSFNELTKKTYGFDFENWYKGGYWKDKYIPCSLVDDGRVIANVSINIMDFELNGVMKQYIQLGTVMTAEEFRNQGLSRYIIEKVLEDWKEKSDGFYLFANDNVLEFYPKFGFRESNQFQYSKKIDNLDQIDKHTYKALRIDMTKEMNQGKLYNAICNSMSYARLSMKNNPDLIMFYTTSFKNECVYYIEHNDTFVIADVNDKVLLIHEVICDTYVDLENVIKAFAFMNINKVVLEFTPVDISGYTKMILKEENTTLFILGDDLENMEKEFLMFPTLSHA